MVYFSGAIELDVVDFDFSSKWGLEIEIEVNNGGYYGTSRESRTITVEDARELNKFLTIALDKFDNKE